MSEYTEVDVVISPFVNPKDMQRPLHVILFDKRVITNKLRYKHEYK